VTAPETTPIFPQTSLAAENLILRPFTPADADDVTQACQDIETLPWLPLPRPYTRANAEWFIGTFGPSQRESGAGIVFAIESAGRLVGAIDLKGVNWAARVAEVGYWVAPWARGRGVAAQATRVLSEWAIRDHGFERVQLFAATGNAASQRVAEKAGFVREGVARNACCMPDGRADMVLFSLIPHDLQTPGTASTSQAAGSHLEDSTSIAASSERSASPGHDIALVGIGADGWSGLTTPARAQIEMAGVVIGGQRQLDLLPDAIAAQRVPWPSPMRPVVAELVSRYRSRGLVVLASGDPMFFGIGRALVEEVGPQSLLVLPHPSSISLACARLGWPVEDIDVVSLVGRPLASLTTSLHDRRRILVLSNDAVTPTAVAKLLTGRGFGGSTLTMLEQLGAPGEARRSGVAQTWDAAPGDPLNVVAVECLLSREGTRLGLVPGLADAVYEDDGQLTKREVRAVTLSSLAPSPGELLWDIGGGAGSIAIEWMRAHRTCRAIAVESDNERAARIGRNADALGVPGLRILNGRAPAVLVGLPSPEAIFIGGGLTTEGLLDAAWAALKPGGRLVANTVTLESEALLARWYTRNGGELIRISASRAKAVGGFTGWQPAMPVTQWSVTKAAYATSPQHAPSTSKAGQRTGE
jgi:precorrin-6B C5,15-methyltransferase / cobalt-precorrin-6B C5,C15-methyltransferase